MPFDIEQIKKANPIQDVVAETEPMRAARGHHVRAQKHDSLVVDTRGQYYAWNSKNETGDVIDWVIRYRGCADFHDAVEWLCRRAGLPAPEWGSGDAVARMAARAREDALTVYARWAVRQLRASKAAMAYAAGRGWSSETIMAAGLGYSGESSGRKDLLGELSMHGIETTSDGARAVLGIPVGMLVYPHISGGRVRYLSARSIEGKSHYNLTEQHAGPRQPYANTEYAPGCESVVVVEGQADAITWGQWGQAAIALAGTAIGDELAAQLRKHKVVYWSTDADEAGRKALEQAGRLGPLTRVLRLSAKDANEWLREANPTKDDVRRVLMDAPTYVEHVCALAKGDDDAILDAMRVVAQLPEDKLALKKNALAGAMGIRITAFSQLLKTIQEGDAEEKQAADDERPTVQVAGTMLLDDGTLLDVLYCAATDMMRLAVRHPDGRIEERGDFDAHGVAYVPALHPTVQAAARQPLNPMMMPAILMPGGLGPEISITDLHAELMTFTTRYLDVDEGHRAIACYYVMLSWLYDCFRDIGYLRAMGPTGKGKSRYVDTFGALCYRTIRVAGLTTLSPMFRIKSLTLGTFCMDEINSPFIDAPAELELFFNLGISVHSPPIWRSEGKESIPTAFNGAYGPKVFGAIKEFKDPATNSRCMTVRMTVPTTRTDIGDIDEQFHHDARELRKKLMTFRMRHWRKDWAIDRTRLDPRVMPRLRQITAALVTIIPDEGTRAKLQQVMFEQNAEALDVQSQTITAKVVRALANILKEKQSLGKQGRMYRDLRLKRIYDMVREMVFDEEEAPPALNADGSINKDSPRNSEKHWINRYYSPRRIGEVVRVELGYRTAPASWDKNNGRTVEIGDEDLTRLRELMMIYGVVEEEKAEDGTQKVEEQQADEYLA